MPSSRQSAQIGAWLLALLSVWLILQPVWTRFRLLDVDSEWEDPSLAIDRGSILGTALGETKEGALLAVILTVALLWTVLTALWATHRPAAREWSAGAHAAILGNAATAAFLAAAAAPGLAGSLRAHQVDGAQLMLAAIVPVAGLWLVRSAVPTQAQNP